MRKQYTLEIVFVAVVILLSLVGFSSLARSQQGAPNAYQLLHIVTSLAWLTLLLGQLVLLRQRRNDYHRTVGTSIMAAGPILVASVSLLTVHSAAKAVAAGTVDDLVVQNVTFSVQLALLIFLAFALQRNRKIHGALLLSTALLFLVVATFFTLISYVPGYRIEGPETFDRFAKSGQLSALVGSVLGVLFFLRHRRTGWPWLVVSAFFFLSGYLQGVLDYAALTTLFGSLGELPTAGVALASFFGLLWVARRGAPVARDAS
jgi:hypothetical protein